MKSTSVVMIGATISVALAAGEYVSSFAAGNYDAAFWAASSAAWALMLISYIQGSQK